MSIFKRIEIWILLVLAVAGLVFVLLSQPPSEDDLDGGAASRKPNSKDTGKPKSKDGGSGKGSNEFAKDGTLVIESVELRESSEPGDFLAEVHFTFNNDRKKEVRCIDEAKIVSAGGKSHPVFFLAFEEAPAVFAAGEKGPASLMFSLPKSEVVGTLELNIAGQRAALKSGRTFDPQSITPGSTKTLKSLDW